MYTTRKVKEGMNKPESEGAEEKESAPKMMQIEVTTLRNGYALMYEGSKRPEGFLYFSPQELVKGIMCHIGLNMNDELDMAKADAFIEATLKWKDTKKAIKEINSLTSKLREMTAQRNKFARQYIIERGQLVNVITRIRNLADDYTDSKNKNADTKEVGKDIRKIIDMRNGRVRKITPASLGIKDNIYAAADINDDEEDEA